MLATAAALCARAETIELITNGDGTTLEGWEFSGFKIYVDDYGKSFFCPAEYSVERSMAQKVKLTDAGLTEEDIQQYLPVVTASVGVSQGTLSQTYRIRIHELSESEYPIEEHKVENQEEMSISFSLNAETRYLRYEVSSEGEASAESEDGTKFFDCSMTCDRRTITFVSSGESMGTAKFIVGQAALSAIPRAPVALREGNGRFLGYFTEETGGDQLYDANYDRLTSALYKCHPTVDITIYAHWSPMPVANEGKVTRLVYRGVLTNFGEWTSGLARDMLVKLYDSASAATPLWTGDVPSVPINPDGSFEAVFGDGELALAFASNDVTHVELTVGDSSSPLAPRRALSSVASVNRALVAEGAARDVKVGTLGANAIVAESVVARSLEASETVRVEGSVSVEVKPFNVDLGRETTIWRGAGVTAWGDSTRVATESGVFAGQLLWTSDREGVAMVHATGATRSALRIPATIQFVRPGDEVRAPTWESGEVSVTVWGYKR